VAILQHRKRVLGIFSSRMRRNSYLGTSGQKSDPPFAPVTSISYNTNASPLPSDVYWIYSMFLCYYVAWPFWPWPLTFWPWKCFMYSASHIRPTYQFLLSYGYRLLSYEYWISDHISVIWNSHCACAVSRDLWIGVPPKPHVIIFWPRIAYSLYNFYAATMTIIGSLYLSIPMLKRFSVAKKN